MVDLLFSALNHLTWQLAPLGSMSQKSTVHYTTLSHKTSQGRVEAPRGECGLPGVYVKARYLSRSLLSLDCSRLGH